MKKILLIVVASMLTVVGYATDQVTFTRLAYDDGSYIYRTCATNPDTPYATQIRPTQSGNPYVYEIILFNKYIEKVYSFSVKAPEDHDYCCTFNFANDGGSYINDIIVTQYLFNDDDLYEIVFRGSDDSRWIYNEKGEFLGEIPPNVNKLYEHDGTIYLYAEYDEGTDGKTISALYEVNKDNNAVMTVSADETRLTAAPNPVKPSDTVTITLPMEISSDMLVNVFNTDGVLLIKKECSKGENKISIPAYRLSSGVNPVVVIDADGNIISTGKIIRE